MSYNIRKFIMRLLLFKLYFGTISKRYNMY